MNRDHHYLKVLKVIYESSSCINNKHNKEQQVTQLLN